MSERAQSQTGTQDSGELNLVTDENGDFDRLELSCGTPVVSELCEDQTIDVDAELQTRGFTVTTRSLSEFVMPVDTAGDWKAKAKKNVDEWGLQSAETLLLAMQEEMGELTQAHLEARDEDGDPDRIEDELADLGALCYQLHWVLSNKEEP